MQLTSNVFTGESIRCYQCSSDEDKSKDHCGAYERFDTLRNTQVDCASAEADVPGKASCNHLKGHENDS